jgi:hypothetical protein
MAVEFKVGGGGTGRHLFAARDRTAVPGEDIHLARYAVIGWEKACGLAIGLRVRRSGKQKQAEEDR